MLGSLMRILTDSDDVLCGIQSSQEWASGLDSIALRSVQHLVAARSVLAAVGSWGWQDGCPRTPPMAWIGAEPAHAPFVAEELVRNIPHLLVYVRSTCDAMRFRSVGARVLWGEALMPPMPPVDQWAQWRASERHHGIVCRPVDAQDGRGGVEDWHTLRCCLALAGTPYTGQLPRVVARLITARNLGVPLGSRFSGALGEFAAQVLSKLMDGESVYGVGREVQAWLDFWHCAAP